MGTWDMIKDERGWLVGEFAALPATAWNAPSLAAGWSNRDVLAHMIATAQMTPPKFVGAMLGSRIDFKAMSNKRIANVRAGKTDEQLIDTYRSLVNARTAPPGPSASWLGETIVHSEDIFRSLGAYRDHPVDHVTAVADFYKGSNLLIGAKRRIDGVTLRATDTNWTYGNGPEVGGPAIALVMAMTGRKAALDDLDGPGVDTLRSRP